MIPHMSLIDIFFSKLHGKKKNEKKMHVLINFCFSGLLIYFYFFRSKSGLHQFFWRIVNKILINIFVSYLYRRSWCSWKKYWSTHYWWEIACIQVVHDIADNILNHTYIYIVEIGFSWLSPPTVWELQLYYLVVIVFVLAA
jgi:hypothetical protein